jgi:hypothetical protein
MSPLTRQFVFQGAQSSTLLACHLAAVGLAVLFIFVLSRYERQLVSRTVGSSLLALRLGVLGVILLTLLQPTLSWTRQQHQAGRILVGIDLSESMATIDRHAGRGEKLRVARGLEMIGNAAHEARLDRWQKAFDADQQPEWVDPDEFLDEVRRTAVAESRRENLEAIFEDVDKLSRAEIARRLLVATRVPLLGQLAEAGRVELFAFAGQAESIEPDLLDRVVAEPSPGLLTEKSDLSIALQRGANGGGTVSGTIIFTDGRDHSGQNLAAIAATLKASHSPVFPVLVGSGYRPKDLSIAMLDHPQTVYKGDHPQLKVTLNTVGFDGKKIDIELVPEDEPAAEPIRQSVTCVGTSTSVEFSLDANEVGRKSFVVRTPVQEGETRDDNNSRTFALRVVDDRARVILIEGEARWEFRYLSAALSRDERIDLQQVLFDQPYLGVLPEPFFPRRLVLPADPTDLATSPFAETDLVIIGDVSPGEFPDSSWQLLLKFVSEGGTLVLSAGQRHLPLGHRSPALDQLLPISKLIPVSLVDKTQEAVPLLRGLPLQLTADGEQQPMLQFGADLAQNIGIWKGLPGQMWAMVGEAKPGSTVWATTLIPAGRIESLPAERKYGIIVHQFVGSGQVVWLGMDATWRWRYRVGDRYHHRFWAQLARWAATNKMSAGTDFVRFGADKGELEIGQEVLIRARWTHAFLQKNPNLKARAEFYRQGDPADQVFTTLDLVPAKGRPLQYEGRVSSLPAGDYQVRLAVDQALPGDKRIETTVFVHEKPSAELSDLSANRDLLVQIASASGGRLFLPDEVRELSSMFEPVEETAEHYEEMSLWDRWPWLIVLFTLMMCEWITRKLNGLP